MCQLLGMNCNVPTDIVFSFTGFQHRGGDTDEHRDGWGIAFYEGRGCRLFLDTTPASESPVATLVKTYPIRSLNVIAHIRKATVGQVLLENTHPFIREMWGRYWVFAHNGTLDGLRSRFTRGERNYQPVGSTDSELAFCELLETLRREFPAGEPAVEALGDALRQVTQDLATAGDFNYLLSNGDALFAHCATRLSYVVRKAPFTTARLLDEDYEVDFSRVTTPDDRVAVIATTPLTCNERWEVVSPQTLLVFQDGMPTLAA